MLKLPTYNIEINVLCRWKLQIILKGLEQIWYILLWICRERAYFRKSLKINEVKKWSGLVDGCEQREVGRETGGSDWSSVGVGVSRLGGD